MDKSVTIVCVCYRRYDQLPILIYAFMAQTLQNFRLLVLHDGPDERMHALLLRYKAEFPDRLSFVFSDKRHNDYGHSLRDLGIKLADSDYLLITNDDNYYCPRFLEFMFVAIERDDLDLVLCNMVHSYDIHGIPSYNVLVTQPKRLFVDIGCFIVRTAIAKQVGFRDKSHDGDATFVEDLPVAKPDIKIGKVDKVLFVHN